MYDKIMSDNNENTKINFVNLTPEELKALKVARNKPKGFAPGHQINVGKKQSEEHKRKISEALLKKETVKENRNLTFEQAQEIRQLHYVDGFSYRKLAEKFNTNTKTISNIVNNITYKR
jgi:DNA-directed RNA polymerase specialized sigma24 family protein